MAGPQGSIKALRAVAYSPKVTFQLWVDHSDGNYSSGIAPGASFTRSPYGYEAFAHSLGFNTYHLVLKSKRPGFMPVLSEEAVWQELNDGRFTTPIVREWAGYICEQMLINELIVKAKCYGCDCAYMVAEDEQLDKIVRKGLMDKAIKIV